MLAQLVGGRLAFLNERKPGRAKIAVGNPEGALSGITTIDIVNDDMPFLVDSTIGLLAERGHEVRLALHPVVAVKRDASGKLLDLAAKPAADGTTTRESFIHIHLARLAPDEAAALEADLRAVFADVRQVVIDWRAMQQRLREAIDQLSEGPAAHSDRGIHRDDGVPAMAARQSFHLSRHARIPICRRRREGLARSGARQRARHSARCCEGGSAGSLRRETAGTHPRISTTAGTDNHNQVGSSLDGASPGGDGLCGRQAVRQRRRTHRRTARHRAFHLVGLYPEPERHSAAQAQAHPRRAGQRLLGRPAIPARR